MPKKPCPIALVVTLLLTPLLLAPVRYQSGDETILLAPSQGPSKAAFALPAAGALSSPTVIEVSPTLLSPTIPVSAGTTPSSTTQSSPKAPAEASAPPVTRYQTPIPSDEMPATAAIICTESLKAVIDISLLSYQQKQQRAVAKVTMAATVAGTEAEARRYPNLGPLLESLNQISFGTPQKRELQASVANAQTACANPNPRASAPGSRIPVERPN